MSLGQVDFRGSKWNQSWSLSAQLIPDSLVEPITRLQALRDMEAPQSRQPQGRFLWPLDVSKAFRNCWCFETSTSARTNSSSNMYHRRLSDAQGIFHTEGWSAAWGCGLRTGTGQLGPDASHYHSSSKSTNWLERFMDVQGLSFRPITSYNFMMNPRRDQDGRSQSCFFPTLGFARQTSDRQHQPAWVPLDHRDSTVQRIKALSGNMGSGTIKGCEKWKDDNKKALSVINSYHTYTLRIII